MQVKNNTVVVPNGHAKGAIAKKRSSPQRARGQFRDLIDEAHANGSDESDREVEEVMVVEEVKLVRPNNVANTANVSIR